MTKPCKLGAMIAPNGYARISISGKSVYEHRVAYCKAHGLTLSDIKGKVVRHTCDNPPCVEPEHLVLGSHADNVADRHTRGRDASGELHGMSKLTVEQVAAIRAEYVRSSRQFGSTALAIKYNVHPSTILFIIRGTTWNGI